MVKVSEAFNFCDFTSDIFPLKQTQWVLKIPFYKFFFYRTYSVSVCLITSCYFCISFTHLTAAARAPPSGQPAASHKEPLKQLLEMSSYG